MTQPSAAANDRLIGQIVADRYQILRVLGEGGMGRVYLAEHVRMGRKSAVKVMSPNMALSADAISRFNREAANASRINHPNVAQIYDFGETADGMLYLAMEYVEGETLRSLIERGGPLPVSRAAQLTNQIADALGAAHHLGIVHRDLKPDNILLTRHHDGADWVKVVDFGIAKTVQGSGGEGGSQTVTTAGVSLGTPEYMSPEQLAGERLDPRTDLYSLGLVLFTMLTANLPYPRVTSKETLVRRLTSRPLTLADVVPGVAWPPALQAALDRALAPEPADRYANVGDFGREVVAAAAGVVTAPTAVIVPVRPTPGPTQRIDARRARAERPARPARPARDQSTTRRRVLAIAGSLLVVVAGAAGAFVAFRARPNSANASTAVAAANPSANPSASPIASPGADSAAPTSPPAVADSGAAPSSGSAPRVPSNASDSATSATSAAAPTPAVKDTGMPSREVRRNVSTRSVDRVPAARLASSSPGTDSPAAAAPPPAPTTSGDTTAANRARQLARMRHTWLRASGDTAVIGATMPASDADRIRVLGDDIQGHLQRARDFIQRGEIGQARAEYRDMMPVANVLHQLYAGTPGQMRVEQSIRAAVAQSLMACRSALQDPTARGKFPPNFRCEQLIPPGMRGQRGGRNFSPRDR